MQLLIGIFCLHFMHGYFLNNATFNFPGSCPLIIILFWYTVYSRSYGTATASITLGSPWRFLPVHAAPPDISMAKTISFTSVHSPCKSSKSTFETLVETGKSHLGNDPVDDYI